MSKTDLYIYHTNDLHSYFASWPQVAGFLKEKRDEHVANGDAYLILDIGDHADRAHSITEASAGKANVTLLNEVGYHCVTIGNNEGITLPKEDLNTLYQDAAFPVVVSNLLDNETGDIPNWARESLLLSFNGLNVGIIGLTAPFYPFYQKLGWTVVNPDTVLPSLINKMKDEADLIILLSHLGLHADEKLATAYPEIQVILGAHTHHLLESGVNVGETSIGQTGKFGHYVGQVKVTFDDTAKKVASVHMEVIKSATVKPSKETKALLEQLKQETDEKMEEVIVELKEDVALEWFEPSPAIQLVTEALKDWCKTDISMVNAGILLEALPAGPITKADIHRICPHPINPCNVTIRGDALKEVIELAATEKMKRFELKGLGFRGKVLGAMVYNGIEVTIEGESVQSILVLGVPLDKEKHYTIATLDMFTFGKLYPSMSKAEKDYFMPELLRDVLAAKLTSL